MILYMGGNIPLFSSVSLCGHFFCVKIQKTILVMSLNCDAHLAEQKLVNLTVVSVDLKRHIISTCKLYLLGHLDYHGYNYTIVNTWRSACLGRRYRILINFTRA